MTYMALARKWRPKQFSDVVGQSHVVQALSNALNSGRVHHAYLLTGTRGVGKTTLARILAKSLNCETGMSSEPCLQCSVCVSVDQGNYVDLIEVDAASRTGIDDMRELLDNVQYAPTSGQFKVYLIDEVHMLSKSSFNALLKTLEEPPEHVKFIFATTDPQKLPVTVLSRCLQFNLQALQPNQIANQIYKILDAENIQYNAVAIDLLARAADGSMRDSLSLLEQAIAQGSGAVQEEDVRAMLGTVKSKHLDSLLSALIANDADALLQTVQEMAVYSIDFQTALDQLLLDLHHISLAHLVESALANKVDDVEKYLAYAKQITIEDTQLLYQIGLISKRDLPLAPDHRSGFEMAMMRMLAFKPTSQDFEELPLNDATANKVNLDKKTEQTSTQALASTKITASKVETIQTSKEPLANEEPSAHKEQKPLTTKEQITPRSIDNQTIPGRIEPSVSPSVKASNEANNAPDIASDTTPDITQKQGTPLLGAAADIAEKSETSTSQFNNIQQQRVEPSIQARPTNTDNVVNAEDLSRVSPPITPRTVELQANTHRAPIKEEPIFTSQPHASEQLSARVEVPDNRAVSSDSDEMDFQVRAASASSWAGMAESLNLNGLIKELAMNMACEDITADPMVFNLSPNWTFLHNQPREDSIVKEIHKQRGDNCAVKIVFEDTVSETPAERLARLKEERVQQTKTDLNDDKGVQDLMDTFELSMKDSTIKPTNEPN